MSVVPTLNFKYPVSSIEDVEPSIVIIVTYVPAGTELIIVSPVEYDVDDDEYDNPVREP